MQRRGRFPWSYAPARTGAPVFSTIAAIVALFLNQALGPAHYQPALLVEAHAGHADHVSLADTVEPGGSPSSEQDYKHQTCHFCRLLGAVLPAPRPHPLIRVAIPARIAWGIVVPPRLPGRDIKAGHPVRGPPPGA
jgi:hypothetical protein